MDDPASIVVPLADDGVLGESAWVRLRDLAAKQCVKRALGPMRQRYQRRVDLELVALEQLVLQPGVLLELSAVVDDLRQRGVVFGSGFGPQSGSLLLHLLGLHTVDPIAHDLPFVGFGREVEARRLHICVASRVEQAEVASALRRLRRWTGGDRDAADTALQVVVGRNPGLAFSRDIEQMAIALEGSADGRHAAYPSGWDDAETLRLIARGETEGVDLLGEAQLREQLPRAAPRSLEEVVQLVVVCSHATGSGRLEEYLAARSGVNRPPLPHPSLEEILAPSANIWLYREQAVAALCRLLGCDAAAALDLCRRLEEARGEGGGEGSLLEAMAERVAAHCRLPYARGHYLTRVVRQALFDTVDRATTLARVTEAYRQAYFKARYPAAFHAARLNVALALVLPEAGLRYPSGAFGAPACPQRAQLIELCREVRRDGLELLPPSINHSNWGFIGVDRMTIRFGLGAVARGERRFVEAIVLGRKGQPYRGLREVAERALAGVFAIEQLEPLILAGAFDALCGDRWHLLQQLQALCSPPRQQREELVAPGPGWRFQRELDVLGCVPSQGYYPDLAAQGESLRPVP